MAKALSEMIADDILSMINVEKRFKHGDKLPNENDFSKELNINRATLREAIRILTTNGVLEIKRGKGTFVREKTDVVEDTDISSMAQNSVDIKDLYEMRIIIEPEAAFLATQRATDTEFSHIIELGKILEQKLLANTERTKIEQDFHKAIAKATHNKYMNQIVPILFQAIYIAVEATDKNEALRHETIRDHRLIMDFMKQRDAEGAMNAMRLHILHAMRIMENSVNIDE
ncbi:MAG: FadR family transcriptional regulator [Clostridia bacterium]|jgi:DNA-binding FadR family transcriptional regulator|nr:FadR family transcriptional regulator [Clostridia bacterium]MCI1959874.1 FadR family transcriptional regulator [Clostridia bacterium]MCI2001176.1 FadR family transcriptional regulator [Clostridia bacterium]MCI2015866.1 FadR family transcriptional regulator [Clostridia bacterium]